MTGSYDRQWLLSLNNYKTNKLKKNNGKKVLTGSILGD